MLPDVAIRSPQRAGDARQVQILGVVATDKFERPAHNIVVRQFLVHQFRYWLMPVLTQVVDQNL